MKRNLLKTGDGSLTLHIPEWDEQYHSKHGAVAEAVHVFIQEGLKYWTSENLTSSVSILEIGFGTGLNTLLTVLESNMSDLSVDYTGVEGYPLSVEEAVSLNYPSVLKKLYSQFDFQEIQAIFSTLHHLPWEEESHIAKHFTLTKVEKKFHGIQDREKYDLIYFDAFGIRVQPELWTEEIFQKMFNALKPNGILVTYAANGHARRAMQAVGFSVERLPGPPGKKEMLRSTKRLT